ncbi:MAG: YbbC/YhhH family protein [Weeksellaceae bacterium]|nr:YbbC/YhhH family protein [Weeksellaceae bacterium]
MKTLLLLVLLISCGSAKQELYRPEDMVPTEDVAVKIAKVYWGKSLNSTVYDEYIQVTLVNNDIWYLVRKPKLESHKVYGGVLFIKIKKSDGKILSMGNFK